ncbi:hypothetical protein [Actinomadura livida]|uniref:Uncharacterized protein n=2 Tax=Actinomadura livida TaxID=79909 RepID=A0A7W7MWF9_9ACTN|nr:MULTISPECIES: hypothetical protein [Actinomadura]MBB4773706.1 hypothetical protein [Actinomadura catellatispora]
MTMRRMVAMAGGAVAPIALLALLFNNQWVVEAVRDEIDPSSGLGPLVGTFQYPHWILTPRGNMDVWFVVNLQFLLFLVVLALLVFAAARTIDPGRGPLGSVIAGWWATTIAGGVSGLIGGVLLVWALDVPSTAGSFASRTIWNHIGNGASFGLLFGWIAGLGALAAFVLIRPRGQAQQPAYGGQPYGQQPYGGQQQPYAQQPYAQQPQGAQMPQPGMPRQPHPSAVPYVPPQGQPHQPQQQAQWGAPAVPQQAGAPQQFGAPPVPQQQPAQEPAQPAPEAPKPPEAERADAADQEKEAPGAAAEAPADDPEDDDLNLPDRTIVDRKRDDG